jgi:hypothetical protein
MAVTRLAAVAVLVAGMALPGWGQRGAARGGAGGGAHAALALRGGGSVGMSVGGGMGFSGAPSYRGPGFVGAAGARSSYAGRPSYPGSGYPAPGHPPIYPPGHGYTYTRTVHYSVAYPAVYGYPGYYPGYYGAGLIGSSYLDYGAAANNQVMGYGAPVYSPGYQAPAGYDAGPVDQTGVAPNRDAYRPAYVGSRSVAPAEEEAVTLVFRDRRPAEQIHNYILTSRTLFVQDGRRREIAVADLDLEATARVNREAGLDFQLPERR